MLLPTATRNVLADALGDLFDWSDPDYAYIKWYNAAETTLMAESDMSAAAFAAASSGEAVAAAIADADAESGVDDDVRYAKFYDAADTLIMTCGVGTTGSGRDIIMANVGIAEGDSIRMNSFKIVQPAGSA